MKSALPHPSEMTFPTLTAADMAHPQLWASAPVRRLPDAESYLNLRYAMPVGWRPLLLDLHLPLHRDGSVPVVVYAHGGSYLGGVKELGPWAELPRQGIAVASVSYRLAGEASYPEPIEDVLAAIRWVRAHADEFGLDADRIAGWGSSAGGYLMARAALSDDRAVGRPVGAHTDVSARLSAVLLHYGTADFGTLLEDAFEPTDAAQQAVASIVSIFFDRPMAESGALLESASVVRAVEAAHWRPPVHLSHGDADHRVGLAQSQRLLQAWTNARAEASLIVIAGADHAQPVFATPAVVDADVAFLRRVWSRERIN